MAPIKKKKPASAHNPYTQSLGEMSDSSKPRVANGVKGGSAPKMVAPRRASSSASSGRDKAAKKSSKRPPSKKQSRKGDNRDGGTSPPPPKRRKPKPESATSRASYTDDDSSSEDDGGSPRENSRLPAVRPFVLFIASFCFFWNQYILLTNAIRTCVIFIIYL